LEKEVENLGERLTDTSERLRAEVRDEIEAKARELQEQTAKDFADLRAVVRTALGDISLRVWGVLLVLAGIACGLVADTWLAYGFGWAIASAAISIPVIVGALYVAIGREANGDG
jgi:hypothetical protein